MDWNVRCCIRLRCLLVCVMGVVDGGVSVVGVCAVWGVLDGIVIVRMIVIVTFVEVVVFYI